MKSVISALIAAFNLLLDPKMLLHVLWPMLVSVVVWTGVAIFFWGTWTAWLTSLLQSSVLQKWMEHGAGATFSHYLVGILLFVLLLSIIYLTALVLTAVFAVPAMVVQVADTYYPELEPKRGGTMRESIINTVAAVAIYLGGWLVSLPFWLFTPLAILLPVLLAAYLNQRLFRFDALAEHASREEFAQIVKRSSPKLYALGAIAGLLQFMPVLNLFAPVYAGLAFTHLCLGELTRLREQASAS